MKIPRYEPMNPAGWDCHLVIAIDYDGTMTDTDGNISLKMIEFVKYLKKIGCIVILWTSRYGCLLREAIYTCANYGLFFDYINENPFRRSSSKISADIYLDDKAFFTIERIDAIKTEIEHKFLSGEYIKVVRG